jgi:hypothetical protein
MRKAVILTQSSVKRTTAAAISAAKKRRAWSNGDAGDALGCSANTIANRLDADDPKHQMSVYELLRSVPADGVHIANDIFADVQHRLVPDHCDTVPDAIDAAGAAARCAADILTAGVDGFSKEEAEQLLPGIVDLQVKYAGLEALLRRIARGEQSG